MGAARIGNVTKKRYAELVALGVEAASLATQAQWRIGDYALEIEPIRPAGGAHPAPGTELVSVSDALSMYSADLDIPAATIESWRYVASRWPEQHRQPGVSFAVHKALAAIADERDRFRRILRPPLNPRTGRKEWTTDAAHRAVGWAPSNPVSVAEKVEKIHDLAGDDAVAAQVATDFLRRPTVAFKAMTDHVARHAVNRAQIDQAQQAGQVARQRTPAIERVTHTHEFVELVGACAAFVASVGRALPTLDGHRFTGKERQAVHDNIARVRATCEWMETAVDTGNVTLDEGLARLLRGR